MIWAVRAAFGLAIGVLLVLAWHDVPRPPEGVTQPVAPVVPASDAMFQTFETPTQVAASRPTPTPPAIVSKMARTTPTALAPPTVVTGGVLRIAISDAGFAPAESRVTVGRSVAWRNDGHQSHDVSIVGGPESGWGSGLIGPSGTLQRVFVAPGRYDYVCSLHPVMRGRVVVEP